MATSSIPAVLAALESLIGAAVDSETTVTWGAPRGDKQRDWVMIGDVSGRQAAAALGQLRREEAYAVRIQVSCVRADVETPSSVATRAFAIFGEIEDVLRADARLGGVSDLIHAQVGDQTFEQFLLADEAGQLTGRREARIVTQINCLARI